MSVLLVLDSVNIGMWYGSVIAMDLAVIAILGLIYADSININFNFTQTQVWKT